jgi:hypothetical protein
MLGKLQMSNSWSISWIAHIIFLEEVMAVLTLKGSQEAEQFVTAMKAINSINLAAKTGAPRTSQQTPIQISEEMELRMRIKCGSNWHKGCPKSYNCFTIILSLIVINK